MSVFIVDLVVGLSFGGLLQEISMDRYRCRYWGYCLQHHNDTFGFQSRAKTSWKILPCVVLALLFMGFPTVHGTERIIVDPFGVMLSFSLNGLDKDTTIPTEANAFACTMNDAERIRASLEDCLRLYHDLICQLGASYIGLGNPECSTDGGILIRGGVFTFPGEIQSHHFQQQQQHHQQQQFPELLSIFPTKEQVASCIRDAVSSEICFDFFQESWIDLDHVTYIPEGGLVPTSTPSTTMPTNIIRPTPSPTHWPTGITPSIAPTNQEKEMTQDPSPFPSPAGDTAPSIPGNQDDWYPTDMPPTETISPTETTRNDDPIRAQGSTSFSLYTVTAGGGLIILVLGWFIFSRRSSNRRGNTTSPPPPPVMVQYSSDDGGPPALDNIYDEDDDYHNQSLEYRGDTTPAPYAPSVGGMAVTLALAWYWFTAQQSPPRRDSSSTDNEYDQHKQHPYSNSTIAAIRAIHDRKRKNASLKTNRTVDVEAPGMANNDAVALQTMDSLRPSLYDSSTEASTAADELDSMFEVIPSLHGVETIVLFGSALRAMKKEETENSYSTDVVDFGMSKQHTLPYDARRKRRGSNTMGRLARKISETKPIPTTPHDGSITADMTTQTNLESCPGSSDDDISSFASHPSSERSPSITLTQVVTLPLDMDFPDDIEGNRQRKPPKKSPTKRNRQHLVLSLFPSPDEEISSPRRMRQGDFREYDDDDVSDRSSSNVSRTGTSHGISDDGDTTDYELDKAWDPDDTSVASTEVCDTFQTSLDSQTLLDSFHKQGQRLRMDPLVLSGHTPRHTNRSKQSRTARAYFVPPM